MKNVFLFSAVLLVPAVLMFAAVPAKEVGAGWTVIGPETNNKCILRLPDGEGYDHQVGWKNGGGTGSGVLVEIDTCDDVNMATINTCYRYVDDISQMDCRLRGEAYSQCGDMPCYY